MPRAGFILWVMNVKTALLCAGAIALASAAVAAPQYSARYSETVPTLDGLAEPAVWDKAAWSAPFDLGKGKSPSKTAPTRFKAIYTAEAIYLYVECMEAHPEKIFDEFQPHEFWLCDVVEVYATALKDDNVHLILSAHGNCNEEISGVTTKRTRSHIEWFGKSKIAKDRWTCEFRLPLVLLGVAPVDGAVKVKLNLSRNKTTEPKEYSSWLYVEGSFANDGGTGMLVLEKAPAAVAARLKDAIDPLKLPEPEAVRLERENVTRIKKTLFGED